MSQQTPRRPRQWFTIDLHLHTPASSDYQEEGVTLVDVLRRAEARGLSAIALTDHNTVAGYRRLQEEIRFLEQLQGTGRLLAEEKDRLAEMQRLLAKVVVFPGFEFTATLGFHILGIFPPEKSVREIEHLLLDLNIPADQLDLGSSTVGASADVLSAYRKIDEAGGLVIAAHANSSNGVAMRGFDFGGQTKIAYTQDPHLHALEVTDLEQRGPRSTAKFFSGTKPEYPRRMHCIQGSDCHRLRLDPNNRKNLGVGDRATDVLLPELSIAALRELFLSNDFARTRPRRAAKEEVDDFIQLARAEGPSIIQAFHESMANRGGKLFAIIADVCAFANANGGTLLVGVSPDPKVPPAGIGNANQAVPILEREIRNKISPTLACSVDIQETVGKKVVRVLVPRGTDPPYAVDDNKVYVREEAESVLAVRDEIVQLVLRGRALARAVEVPALNQATEAAETSPAESVASEAGSLPPPRTGVEVVGFEERDGNRYFTMRDLRNGMVVKNVTQASARRLWHYAVTEYSSLPPAERVNWVGDLALIKKRSHRGVERYDLLQRTPEGMRAYFGVTEEGLHGKWKQLMGPEEE
ncbi:MAG: RNA-binding domain-containing protein [Anaerolineales bacterium]